METIVRNLVHFLEQGGLVDRRSVVNGGLAVSMSRSRNRFLLVKQRSGASYFVKQAMESEAMTRETVAREAEIYRGAFADDRLQPLRDLLPTFRLYDAAQGILITDLVPEAQNLANFHAKLGRCPPDMARRVGEAIASYHRIRFVPGAPQAALFPQKPPWILLLHAEPDLQGLRRSAAASQLLDVLLNAPGLDERLAQLRESWTRDTLIHTDMRWENVLLSPRHAPAPQQRLHVVDWELADIGDAAWDVAGLMQAYLVFWIGSMPLEAGAGSDELMAGAKYQLADIQPALGAFWEGYIGASNIYRGAPAAFLDRCVRMMGARMLVTAFEMCAYAPAMQGHALVLVQTGLNVLERPGDAVRDLLGIAAPAPGRAAEAVP
jgi:hypothetical protein